MEDETLLGVETSIGKKRQICDTFFVHRAIEFFHFRRPTYYHVM